LREAIIKACDVRAGDTVSIADALRSVDCDPGILERKYLFVDEVIEDYPSVIIVSDVHGAFAIPYAAEVTLVV